jgi:CheY-like chemotaxis protein
VTLIISVLPFHSDKFKQAGTVPPPTGVFAYLESRQRNEDFSFGPALRVAGLCLITGRGVLFATAKTARRAGQHASEAAIKAAGRQKKNPGNPCESECDLLKVLCETSRLNPVSLHQTETRPKILLLDDDKDLLDMYQEILSKLPSRPEIFTSTAGARAIAMLESEPFTLLVTDLNMPKMDGLQVLTIVRRKFPELRTVVLTSVLDEQFRSRVYSLGVDLFWHKPSSSVEIKQFLDCLESLIGREQQGGFRGVQSKSLVDLIQLECISQNSTVLKITNGPLTGRIWIQGGEVVDATTDELDGEAAFRRILSWRAGNFESLPSEPNRARSIFTSYQGLLLETVQAQDEAHYKVTREAASPKDGSSSPLSPLSRFPGVEFVLLLKTGVEPNFESRGLENPQPMAEWSRQTLAQFRGLGDRLQAGPMQQIEGLGPHSNVALTARDNVDFCIGWEHDLSAGQIQESMKKLLALWGS